MSFDNESFDYEQYRSVSIVQREEIQEKVFVKWLNFHLQKASTKVVNLFEDLKDGRKLLLLMEELSGEKLNVERTENKDLMTVQRVLNFLRDAYIFLGTLTAAEILRGDRKATLELLWKIILHYDIGNSEDENDNDAENGRKTLMNWARVSTERYYGVLVSDFGASWRDGRAFLAVLHRNRPDLLDWKSVSVQSSADRLELAFRLAEEECGISRLLEPQDVDMHEPDERCVMTYLALLRRRFPYPPSRHPLDDTTASRKENFFFLSNGPED